MTPPDNMETDRDKDGGKGFTPDTLVERKASLRTAAALNKLTKTEQLSFKDC